MIKKSVLVLFKKDLPKKRKEWWNQFDTVIAPKELETTIKKHSLFFVDINSLIDSGNTKDASELVRKLSLLRTRDGQRLSKVVNYKGYELWWIHYDDLMYKFCLPYTQYSRLLNYLKSFSKIHLYKPPFSSLFQCFLNSHNLKYVITEEFSRKISFGILFQVFLSIPFLLWIKLRGPRLMLWTSDQFDRSYDYDFRMKFIYEELRKKNIKFVEFIRSMESIPIVLKHALIRKRPVIYSFAITNFVRYIANFFNKKNKRKLSNLRPLSNINEMECFRFEMAINSLRGVSDDILSIKIIKLILKFIGIKTSIIIAAISRNFYEVLACKLCDIPIIGILHGVSSKYYNVYDFMPEFDGEKSLSVDKYGLWSEWWKEYYIKNSKAYKPEQLYISGPIRPLLDKTTIPLNTSFEEEDLIKVLFVSEQLASPSEVLPYLSILINNKNISVYIKFRSYNDGFEDWLKKNRPDILEKINNENILKGGIQEAITKCDVVVGSHSTGVLEALLQLKPSVFFQTSKWGDYFELESFNSKHCLYVENPQNLIDCVKKSKEIPKEILKELQHRFFGNPYLNGSKWVVDQAEKFL
jgi:hypothetical protein